MLTPKLFSGPLLVSGLHDAGAGPGDDHETGGGNLPAKLGGLLIFQFVRPRARGTEDGDFAFVRIRREDAEGVAQFAHGGLDDAHVAGVLHVTEHFQRVLNDVGDFGFVVAAAFEFDEFVNAAFQLGIHRSLFIPFHNLIKRGRIAVKTQKAIRSFWFPRALLFIACE